MGAVGVVDLMPDDVLTVFLRLHIFAAADSQNGGLAAAGSGGASGCGRGRGSRLCRRFGQRGRSFRRSRLTAIRQRIFSSGSHRFRRLCFCGDFFHRGCTLGRRGLFPAGGPLGLGRFRFLSLFRNRLTGDIGRTIISGNSRGIFAIITVRALCQSSGVVLTGEGVCRRSIGICRTKHLALGEFREGAAILRRGSIFISLVHRGQQLIQIAAIRRRRHISLRFIRGRSVLHGNRGLRSGIFLLQQFLFLGCHK